MIDTQSEVNALQPHSIGYPGKMRGASFIPLHDGVKLTPEQLEQLFPAKRRVQFLREICALVEKATSDVA